MQMMHMSYSYSRPQLVANGPGQPQRQHMGWLRNRLGGTGQTGDCDSVDGGAGQTGIGTQTGMVEVPNGGAEKTIKLGSNL